jgi:hypothetical protein
VNGVRVTKMDLVSRDAGIRAAVIDERIAERRADERASPVGVDDLHLDG